MTLTKTDKKLIDIFGIFLTLTGIGCLFYGIWQLPNYAIRFPLIGILLSLWGQSLFAKTKEESK